MEYKHEYGRYGYDDDGVPLGPAGYEYITECCDRLAAIMWRQPRCLGCGHRVSLDRHATPRQTRTQPPWKWVSELIGRYRARQLGQVWA